MTDSGKKQLENDERYRQFAYKDSVGKLTVGIGRNLKDKGLSYTESLYLFENDIKDAENQLRNRFYWFDSIDIQAQDVMINMAFNMGLGGLLTFTKALEHMKNENYKLAAEDFMSSKWSGQVGDRAVRLTNILKNI